MNKRIFTFCTELITSLGVFYAVFEHLLYPFLRVFIPQFPFLSSHDFEIVGLLINGIFIVLIWGIIRYYGNKFTDIFAVLHLMAQNNKLHPLRELVMVENDQLETPFNHFLVDSASFSYEIKKSPDFEKHNFFDVRYTLTFSLSKRHFPKFLGNYKIFSFYLIAEGRNPPKNKRSRVLVDGIEQDIGISLHPATIKGASFDQLTDFSGLYQAQVTLPFISRKSSITVELSYDIRKNFRRDEKNYNFVIIPRNYGKKMKRLHIQIDAPMGGIYYPEIQKAGASGEWELVDFLISQKTGDTAAQYRKEIQPDMNSVYFIQFDLQDRYS